MEEYEYGYLCVLALALILTGTIYVDEMLTNEKCQSCFDAWNTEHGEHIIGAASNQPIFNGEFVLCKSACTSGLDRQLEDQP
jgi:hypothetical protein